MKTMRVHLEFAEMTEREGRRSCVVREITESGEVLREVPATWHRDLGDLAMRAALTSAFGTLLFPIVTTESAR